MKLLSALGAFAGGFLFSPPPKAVLATIVWVITRCHPVLSAVVLFALASAWRSRDD